MFALWCEWLGAEPSIFQKDAYPLGNEPQKYKKKIKMSKKKQKNQCIHSICLIFYSPIIRWADVPLSG